MLIDVKKIDGSTIHKIFATQPAERVKYITINCIYRRVY